MLKKVASYLFLLIAFKGASQIGGTKTYRFLEIPMTARAAALGGNNMSIWGDDINLLHSNPSLLNPGMVKQAAFNYCNYAADLNFYSLAYAHSLKQYGTAAISLQTFNYGSFTGYDEFGIETTSFKANDNSINLIYAKPFADSSFNLGVALKTIISQYDNYQSIANAIDFGITYHTKKNAVISLQAKNIGFIWKGYSSNDQNEALPQNVQFGMSKKIEKAPFRVFFVYDQLLKWDLSYVSPIDTAGQYNSFSSSSTTEDSTDYQKFKADVGDFLDNFMRHIILGTEIIVTKNFNLRIAYNYRRQKEMTLPEKRGASGFSFGFGFKVKRFGFSYGFNKMSVPASSHMLGLTFCW